MNIALFGELMLRLTPSVNSQKIATAQSFCIDYAGAETNVASSLATLGHQTRFISKLPNNHLGDGAISSLKSYGINTQDIHRGGERLGTYFIEQGASIRPSEVIYDRKHSAISTLMENEFDWSALLEGQDWLHISGITPALSKQCAKETIKAAEVAKLMGVKVSFDMNFRRKLWKDARQAIEIFSTLLQKSDLVHGNTGVLSDVFSMKFKVEDSVSAALAFQDKFKIPQVAFTQRQQDSASKHRLCGVFVDGDKFAMSKEYHIEVVDRFGTGDAYAAAILHGVDNKQNNDWNVQNIVNFATAAFALSHTIPGDQHTSSEQQIQSVASGDTSGHVLR